MNRSIRVTFPSRAVKLTLWEGTDDEESFVVKSLKRGKPYAIAYGVKYYLTDGEIQFVKSMLSIKI